MFAYLRTEFKCDIAAFLVERRVIGLFTLRQPEKVESLGKACEAPR